MLHLIRLMFVLSLVVTCGCGDSNTNSTSTVDQKPASVSFRILWRTIGSVDSISDHSVERYGHLDSCPVEKVQCKVYGGQGEELTSRTWNCSDHQGSLDDIPPGMNRRFVIFGLNEHGRILYRGQADRDYDCYPGHVIDVGIIEAISFVPQLSNLYDGEKLYALNPTIIWNGVAGADEYHFTVSEHSDHSDPVIDVYTYEESYKVIGLSKEKNYYLQIYAVDPYGNTGVVSQINSISVDAITLPDTGQTKSYTDVQGEDSDYSSNPPMYTKLDETGQVLKSDADKYAMVRDETTGLIWEVKTNDDTIHDKRHLYTWQDSKGSHISTLNNQKFGGYIHWRLPTIRELSTLVNFEGINPAIDTNYFPNAISSGYWSSTENIDSTNMVWINWMGDGGSSLFDKMKSAHVRAVYSGPFLGTVSPSLIDNNDGTVTDAVTGLMWQKVADMELRNWVDALVYCENLVLAEYEDWRLPNVRELQSIMDYTKSEPRIDEKFIGNTYNSYWTSTSYADPLKMDTGQQAAWVVNFRIASVMTNDKFDGTTINIYVRAVRNTRSINP